MKNPIRVLVRYSCINFIGIVCTVYVAQEEVRAYAESFDWGGLGGHTGQVMEAVAAKHPYVTCLCLDLRLSRVSAKLTVAVAESRWWEGLCLTPQRFQHVMPSS